ncbi:MAG: hypothetical protein A3G49_01480 [Candidatus Sungbacteria bacterium RIFCSPLOWO2_12_FULL_41_11]|uniref:Peptidase M50 domain-containing protein n=1 Tax=Candidatus Sungbacteria bacterium RIFCSPLOWO2_12_FULL_41_11 TaxID=1802286 RepID=A0A1G2LQU0_9BACT|nr:MAG: Peptidase M50 [Parcubacteria group bacterium GW2011_GWA2_42_14]OHA13894.1 MAG: hypothetical protein A3G49_01480 [Candidatus Sungbacteria bacterium RIFCSPLOWO2_12_FULL_41_11]
MENATQFIIQIAVLIFSVVVHEVSHGYAALALGDKTAKYAGRLTLNPVNHFDPFGSFLLPLFTYFTTGFIFGWAKPVPYNPYNLRNQKWGPALVGAAGPLSNIFLAVFFGIVLRIMISYSLVGSALFANFFQIATFIVFLNLVLAVFNLVPIPPLDGSKVFFTLLPYQYRHIQAFMEQYGFMLLLAFIFFFSNLIFPVVLFLFRIITGVMPVF